MSLKSLKSELSELRVGETHTPEVITVSANGIRFQDPIPLKYCTDYEMLVKPSLKCCRHCGSAWEIVELTDEQKPMFLNQNTGELAEKEEDLHRQRHPQFNDGRLEPIDAIPVIALLTVATVKKKATTSQKIVYDKFKDMTDCPRHTYCKP